MATLQKRVSRGHSYWSIVECRRINGKPRPVILYYLGRAEDLLKRLTKGVAQKVRSYSYGDVAIMLDAAEELQIVEIINKHLPKENKQLRDGFTVGGSLLLAAIGRACKPTSKRGWYEGWARNSSLSIILRKQVNKLDSQHFWDQMAALPVEAIPSIEEELVKTLVGKKEIKFDTLLCDTSNFFSYIDSNNERCSLAQRGRNKQKRMDLKQFGLLLLVSRQDCLPIFHKIYQGNLSDKTVFKEQFNEILRRFRAISGSLQDITIVFDQGNNSKDTLKDVNKELYFIGALSPFQQKKLIEEANQSMNRINVRDKQIECYRTRSKIWELDLSTVIFISEKLRKGQIRGVEQNIKKLFKKLNEIKEKIKLPTKQKRKRPEDYIKKKIKSLISSYVPENLICFHLKPTGKETFALDFWMDEKQFNILKENLFGRRILITNRHQWSTEEIILAYFGQAKVEYVFKNMKNPFHLAVRPQYHWTDQKIQVHGFICLIAFLLSMIVHKRAKEQANFDGTLHNLLEKLSLIRLSTFIEAPEKKTRGQYKTTYRLEEMEENIYVLAESMGLTRLKLKTNMPFSVYK